MKETLIIGHKNPDTDSVTSAYCYAHLKNHQEPGGAYIPARCGRLNQQTRFIFEKFGIEPPLFKADLHPTIGERMSSEVFSIHSNSPISDIVGGSNRSKIRLTPVVDTENNCLGALSIQQITNFFLNVNLNTAPKYLIRPENFSHVINGRIFKKGDQEEFIGKIITGAVPGDRFDEITNDSDSLETLLVTGDRRRIIDMAVKKNFPAIVICGIKENEEIDIDFSDYKGWVYISQHDSAETVRRITLSTPAKYIIDKEIPLLEPSQPLDYAKKLMIDLNYRGFPVVDKHKKLIGIITKTDAIKEKTRKLILMDHNELSQAIDGADKAEIVEIIDHHRLGTIKTNKPINFFARPVGSTCTLVNQLYKINSVEVTKPIASLLLSGILSDTVVLKSPTTTRDDQLAVAELSKIAELDYMEYGIELFSATDNLSSRSAEDVISSDYKVYTEYNCTVGIGQVEAVNLNELDELKEGLIEELKLISRKNKTDWSMLLVTDIIKENSILLSSGYQAGEELISYKKLEANTFYLPGVLSRKKQLLPEILRVLEEADKNKDS